MKSVLCPDGKHHAWRYTAIAAKVSVLECAGCKAWCIETDGKVTDVWAGRFLAIYQESKEGRREG